MNVSTVTPIVAASLQKMTFSWYDYTFFVIMLILSVLIGLYFGCFGSHQSTTSEYLLGAKKMKIFPVVMSLISSHISGITLLAIPADIYRFGGIIFWIFLTVPFTTMATMYIFLPVFYNLEITSTYEYLERRFDRKTRVLTSFIFGLSMFLYMPIVIYIPALAFSAATGVSVHLITPVICGICIFYTTIGGLKAVIWSDTLQFTITLAAVVTVLVLGIRAAGGFSTILEISQQGHRLDFWDFSLDPTKRDSVWIIVFGYGLIQLSYTGVNQAWVQKYMTVPDLAKAKKVVLYYSLGHVAVTVCCLFTGLIMYARYSKCDPFTSGVVSRNDQLLPYYVMDVAGNIPGLPGLFIAGVFCAALSTLSAGLNCLAGTIYEDFICNFMHIKNSSKSSSKILKLLVVVIGVLCTAFVFVIEKCGGIFPIALTFTGTTAGPLLALFAMGMLMPSINRKGAFYGSLIGMGFVSIIVSVAQYYKMTGVLIDTPKPVSVSQCPQNVNSTYMSEVLTTESSFANLSPKYNFTSEILQEENFVPFFLFRISHYYYGTMAFIGCVIFAVIISYFTKSPEDKVNRDHISPLVYFMLPKDEGLPDYYTVEKALQMTVIEDVQKNSKSQKSTEVYNT